MIRALYSGVAGLKTHQTKMDVIGNNIANVNTYGFKASRASFKDVFYQSLNTSAEGNNMVGGLNGKQIGYGSAVNSIDVLHTRSGYSSTGRPMDCYIDGEGYFIARDGAGNDTLSRVGILSFDGAGNLVDANGKYICGFPILRDVNGDIVYQDIEPVSGKTNVMGTLVDFGVENGDQFNGYKINITNKTGTDSVDETNKIININLTATSTKADLQAALRALTGGKGSTLDFSKITVAGAGTDVVKAGVATISGGVSAISGVPMLDTTKDPQMIKKPGTLIDVDGDGKYDTEISDVIELTGIQVSADGVITGTDNNGFVLPIGQICLANVPNPEALTLEGNSYFKAIKNTGEITYQTPGGGVCGAIASNGLELSNVDLSNEFSEMIVTQRGFQANSRIITVGDEMLQELVNLKR